MEENKIFLSKKKKASITVALREVQKSNYIE